MIFLLLSKDKVLINSYEFLEKSDNENFFGFLKGELYREDELKINNVGSFFSTLKKSIALDGILSARVFIFDKKTVFFSLTKNVLGKNITEFYSFDDYSLINKKDIFGSSFKYAVSVGGLLNDSLEKMMMEIKIKTDVLMDNLLNATDAFISMDFNIFASGNVAYDFSLNSIQTKPGLFYNNWVLESFFNKYICYLKV